MFKTKLSEWYLRNSNEGFKRFIQKVFRPTELTADEFIEQNPLRAIHSPIHAMESKVMTNLFQAYRNYELYDILKQILENHGLLKYYEYPYVTDFRYNPLDGSLVVTWDSNTDDDTFYKIVLGILCEGSAGGLPSTYNINIQYTDKNNNVAWGSGYLSYLDAVAVDISEFTKVFERVEAIDRLRMFWNEKTGLYEAPKCR